MYKILVPIDGSDHALKALHIACDLAAKYKALIILLHIIRDRPAKDILALPVSQKFSASLYAALQNACEKPTVRLDHHLVRQVGENILKIAAA